MKIFKISMLALFGTALLIKAAICGPLDNTPTHLKAGDCNRECLMGFLDSYLTALVAHDPSGLNVAGTLKYTDNGVAAQLGEGLWQTATSVDNGKRLDFADPVQGNVATQVVIYEKGGESSSGGCESSGGCGSDTGGSSPVIYQVRLKVEQQAITEIEAMTVRQQGAANGFFNVENMAPEAVFTQPVAAGQRMSRAQLKALLDLYVDYLEGDISGKAVPFDEKCKRYENGVVTASGVSAFESQSWSFNVTRRYPIIDEEAGIIWGMLPFSQYQNALVVGEAFKIINGEIMMIQAVMARMPSQAWD